MEQATIIGFPRNIRSIICRQKETWKIMCIFPRCTIIMLSTIIGLLGFATLYNYFAVHCYRPVAVGKFLGEGYGSIFVPRPFSA